MSNGLNNRPQRKAALIEFLRTIQRPDHPIEDITDDQKLVESGLIDSLALLQIVAYLEQTYQIDFREKGVDPTELVSVGAILNLIERGAA
jgi:acyl carrier protein